MIKQHRKLSLADFSGRGNDISLEINWNDLVKGCKYIKLKVNDREAVIKKDHLWTQMFMLSDDDQQDKMVGQSIIKTPQKVYRTVIYLKSPRDIHKGEMTSVPITITINSKGEVLVKP